VLTALTGNLLAARASLRHKTLTTTAKHYDKASIEAAMVGLKLLEAKSLKGR